MIKKILIANRGEIACRVIQTAKQLGISTVAVYSDADANSQHVKMADEAVNLGPAPSAESYLRVDKIIEVCKQLSVDAVHPGYGFLSENASFANACEANDIIFIGPPASAIEAMGSKSAAKQIMQEAGVPLVPGYHGDDQSRDLLFQESVKIGFPVLLKAAAGGGGKGMRQVWSEQDFDDALSAAKREAMKGFGDDHMLVEKYLTEPRHIEIQVFCDKNGNGVYLFERDCSVQRRHQKIIEEAPAPNFPDDIRRAMGEAAIRAANAINYVGAGTVEFLYDSDGSFYFMEMNTRLQVEHPVTEMITGQDLVEWQIRIAEGHGLPKQQGELSINGHAFEARIYAEDPDNDFLPATGVLTHLQPPSQSDSIRVDTGVVQGDEVSIYYDPMIAKLIVHGKSREQALLVLTNALRQYEIHGVTTNISYLLRVANSTPFALAQLTTDFVERHDEILSINQQSVNDHSIVLAMASVAFKSVPFKSRQQSLSSPFRMNHGISKSVLLISKGEEISGQVTTSANNLASHTLQVSFDGQTYLCENLSSNASVEHEGIQVSATINGVNTTRTLIVTETQAAVFDDSGRVVFDLPNLLGDDDGDMQSSGDITAPMNGTIVSVSVSKDDRVSKGQTIAIVEAMKMEHALKAPFDGIATEVFFSEGDRVDGGAVIISLSEQE